MLGEGGGGWGERGPALPVDGLNACVFAGIAPVGPGVEGVAGLINVVARPVVKLPRSAAMSQEGGLLVKIGFSSKVAGFEDFIDIPEGG